MKNKKAVIILALLAVAIGFGSGYIVRKHTAEPVVASIIRDTTYIDHYIEVPVPEEPESIGPADPVLVPAADISPSADSSMVEVKAEAKTYRDSIGDFSYVATVTGVQASLAALQIQYSDRIITQTKTIVRPYEGWLMSITSDNAVTLLQPEFRSLTALEFSYNTGPFHIGLQGGLLVTKPFQSQSKAFIDPYLGGRVTVDIHKFR